MRVTVNQKFDQWDGGCSECNKIKTVAKYYYGVSLIETLPQGRDYVSDMLTCDYNLAKGLTITGVRIFTKDSKKVLVPFTLTVPAVIHADDWHKYLTIKLDSAEAKKLDKTEYVSNSILLDFRYALESVISAEFFTD